jgi:S1-C subfamily serine protease
LFPSIATGIVTVSLLDQAPPAITQTINRVVERTIERAVPNATTTKETVVIREDQAIIDAIAKSTRSIVRIKNENGFLGIGIIISNTGKILARINSPYVGTLMGHFHTGDPVALKVLTQDEVSGVMILQAEQPQVPQTPRTFIPITFGNSEQLKLGQSVIVVSGNQAPVVATGIISSLAYDPIADNKAKPVLNHIFSSVREPTFDSQAILVNLLGEVIGIKVGTTREDGFIPSNSIKTYATP